MLAESAIIVAYNSSEIKKKNRTAGMKKHPHSIRMRVQKQLG